MSTHETLRPFFDLLCEYQRIERVVHVPGQNRRENNVEHSYVLAMLAWYILSRDKLSLDLNRVIQYALVHDLVEVYAGDTNLFDMEARKTKHKREMHARCKLIDTFPEFPDLHKTIERYERQDDPEARFVKALDKIHPMLVTYVDGGRTWREEGITIDMIVTMKQEHIDRSPELKLYFDSFVEHLRGRPELFT